MPRTRASAVSPGAHARWKTHRKGRVAARTRNGAEARGVQHEFRTEAIRDVAAVDRGSSLYLIARHMPQDDRSNMARFARQYSRAHADIYDRFVRLGNRLAPKAGGRPTR